MRVLELGSQEGQESTKLSLHSPSHLVKKYANCKKVYCRRKTRIVLFTEILYSSFSSEIVLGSWGSLWS